MADKECPHCGVGLSRRQAKKGMCGQCAVKGLGSHDPSAESDDRFWTYLFSRWWGHLIMAAIFLGCSWAVYDHITTHEQTGQSGRIWWLIALIYVAAGKFAATMVFGLPAIVLTISGLVRLTRPPKPDGPLE